ncbi:hypothetical protein RSO41_06120 [Halomonas sp. I1]|uniref:hypothetical protein n=1 Tax=Halomonas sp. I1 TaxID=393536 RepID=UPI0028DF39A0|nr:hypothetical protein [Halomonas sp. I1]MDT8894226.1 hypothetical protein [Halomonas sp. I1]
MPTDTFLQTLTQGGHMTAMALFAVCIAVATTLVVIGIAIERRDTRKQQELDRSVKQARRPLVGPHWSDRHIDQRRQS